MISSANTKTLNQNAAAAQPAVTDYHAIDQLLDLSFEALFAEPVYVQHGEDIHIIEHGDEGLPTSEERFLEISFEGLFNVPVKVSYGNTEEDDAVEDFGLVQSQASTLTVFKVDFGDEGDEISEEKEISISVKFEVGEEEVSITKEPDDELPMPEETPPPAPPEPPAGNIAPTVQDSTGSVDEYDFIGPFFEDFDDGNIFPTDPDGPDNYILNLFHDSSDTATITEGDMSPVDIDGFYGVLLIYEDGFWEYTIDESSILLSSLDGGESDDEVFYVEIFDGLEFGYGTITITVNGAYEGSAPVVLDLNRDNTISLLSIDESQVTQTVNGQLSQMGWVDPSDGFLMYDKDGNGAFTDISEIAFADYHPDAQTDLQGLQLVFDTNQDNVFDAQDDLWDQFGIWQDLNTNGVTDAGEFSSLSAHNVISFNLESDPLSQTSEGNIIHGFSSYTLSSGETILLGDVTLATRPIEEQEVLDLESHSLSDLLSSNADQAPVATQTQAEENLASPEMLAQSFEEGQALEQMATASALG